MKKLIILLLLSCAAPSVAQNIVLNGTQFTQVEQKEQKTNYTYKVKDKTYTVYLSKKGKAYIIRTSKEGKQYKQYVPEIGKRINPKAY